jgi:branched-chain amino acid transport system ATP-binding protein
MLKLNFNFIVVLKSETRNSKLEFQIYSCWIKDLKMLEVNNLMVFFENALAINDLNIAVNEGEIVGVIGSNSAGKTTLMNSLSGLIIDMRIKEKRRGGERITVYGDILFNGENITDTRPDERVKMGIVLCRERHPIFPESSVLENLKIAGYLKKRQEVLDSISYVFDLFPALTKLKTRKAGFLSGGEQQMLAIGMALIVRPKLLLLDEPLLGLSPMMQQVVVDAIVHLKRDSGITVVISEQFARPVLPMIDRGYVVENGMLTLSGTGKDLMDNPEIKSAYFGI